MKKARSVVITLLIAGTAFGQTSTPKFVTDDISNFWKAYDKIIAAPDSTTQYKLLKKLIFKL